MIKAVSHAAAIFLHRRKRPSFVNEIYIKYSNAREYTRQELAESWLIMFTIF